jgi:alpha-tubulin suppressor-like RCC1 family protein
MPAVKLHRNRHTVRLPSPTVVAAMLVLCLLALCAGCNDASAPPVVGDAPVALVRLGVDSSTLLEGTVLQLEVGVQDSTGAELPDRTVRFETTNGTVATVTGNGLVAAHSFGRALVIATSEGAKDTAIIKVEILFRSISAGGAHTCAISLGGRGYCWGAGTVGQIGDGTVDGSALPSLVASPFGFTSLSAGYQNTCGLSGGAALCWGSNGSRQLGNGGKSDSWTPTAVAGGYRFADVRVNALHACAVTVDERALCWGADWAGQIGNGTAPRTLTPEMVVGGLSFLSIAPGGLFTCGVAADGAAHCWGYNDRSQLGVEAADEVCLGLTGDDVPCSTDPIPVTTAMQFRSVVAGTAHACALTPDGLAYCWGDNSDGQLGDGTTARSWHPVAVFGGQRFAALTAGDRHTCGLAADGHAYCWGYNGRGALGTNAAFDNCGGEPCAKSPVQSAPRLTFEVLSAGTGPGSSHTCGVTPDGHAYCWGRNEHGQLGAGYYGGMSFDPVLVSGQPGHGK